MHVCDYMPNKMDNFLLHPLQWIDVMGRLFNTNICIVLEKQHSENPHACILSVITALELCCKDGDFIFARWGMFYHHRQIKMITNSTEDAVTQFLDHLAVIKTFPAPGILWSKIVAPFGK